MVEGARLESVYTVKGIVGSNPTLSAINLTFQRIEITNKLGLVVVWSSPALDFDSFNNNFVVKSTLS